jgi:hypothetical protein
VCYYRPEGGTCRELVAMSMSKFVYHERVGEQRATGMKESRVCLRLSRHAELGICPTGRIPLYLMASRVLYCMHVPVQGNRLGRDLSSLVSIACYTLTLHTSIHSGTIMSFTLQRYTYRLPTYLLTLHMLCFPPGCQVGGPPRGPYTRIGRRMCAARPDCILPCASIVTVQL